MTTDNIKLRGWRGKTRKRNSQGRDPKNPREKLPGGRTQKPWKETAREGSQVTPSPKSQSGKTEEKRIPKEECMKKKEKGGSSERHRKKWCDEKKRKEGKWKNKKKDQGVRKRHTKKKRSESLLSKNAEK